MYLGVNIVNKENVLDYFNLYDRDRTGRINYRDFITEVFTPLEMKRRKIMEEEPNEVGDRGTPQKKENIILHLLDSDKKLNKIWIKMLN